MNNRVYVRGFLAVAFPFVAFIGAAIICTIDAPQAGGEYEMRSDAERSGAMSALDFWSASRSYPDNDIPPATYFREFERATRESKSSGRFPDVITAWHSIGPNNLSGRALSVAVTPQNHNTIYVGSASGGLWRSHTAGLEGDWERVPTGFPVLGVSAIAIDPGDSNTIYIGTGEVYRYGVALGGLVVRTTRGSFGMGILRTTDYGATWTKSLDWSLNQERGVQAVKLNPLNPHTIFAATTIGFFRSQNGGESWDPFLEYPMAQDFIVNRLDTNLMIISTGNFHFGSGLQRTSDGGATWDNLDALPDFTGKTLLEDVASSPNVVFADIADSTEGTGSLWKSTDFGLTWSVIDPNPGIYSVQGWYSHFVTAHPSDPNQIVHASVQCVRSTNGGASFSAGVSGSYSDHHSYAHDPANPDILYVVNDDGPYRSTNFGASFSYIGTNLVTGQFYNGFSNSASDSLLAIGQVQDHIPGYIYHGSHTWARGVADEVGWTAIDPTNDSIMYAIDRNMGTILRSTNRGASFSGRASYGAVGAWNSPIVVSPSSPNVVYAADKRLRKSTNTGNTFFTPINSDIDGNAAISLAVSGTSPDTLLIGLAPLVTRGEVYRSVNGGLSWENVTWTLPDRYPLDLAFDPKDSRTVYATFGGFGSGHVFKSTSTGMSWSDISGTLPDIPTGAVFVDPSNSNYLYVGNDMGVYVSTNAGGSWSPFSEGLPEAVLVSDLSYTPSNRTLRVATHGNGVFERKLDSVLPALTLLTPQSGDSVEANAGYDITWGSGLVGKIRIEYSSNDGASWNRLADSIPAASSSYPWTPPFDITTQARIRITSDEGGGISSVNNPPFTIFYDGIISRMRNGWNLVAISLDPQNPAASIMFPSHYGGIFDYASGAYRKRDTLDPQHGYWVKFIGAQTNGLKGSPLASLTVPVSAGWNLFGSLSVPVSAAQISSDPPDIMNSGIFSYDGGKYVFADSILPGRGYWVRTSGGGTITIAPVLSEAKRNAARPVTPSNSLTFIDKESHTQTLYVVHDTEGDVNGEFALPPVPPAGSFDIRFTTNTLAENVVTGESKRAVVALQGVTYPLAISWDFRDKGLSLSLSGYAARLSGKGELMINNPSTDLLTFSIAADAVPTAMALQQNFPNPFNPATVIRYSVPRVGQSFLTVYPVSLRVYDMLGQVVATLVNESKAPGEYSATWDAQSFPSGMYVYRLTSGSLSISRKLLLIR